MKDIVERLRYHVAIRGGPAKDEDGNYVGTTWPMMLEAADEIQRLRKALNPFAMNVEAASLGKALGHISREHLWAARDALTPAERKDL